jgi:ATP-dependent helicase/nuclease subunit A
MLPGAREFAVAGDRGRIGWRVRSAQVASVAVAGPSDEPVALAAPPAWLDRPAPAEPEPTRPLSPSRPAEEEQPVQSPLSADAGARFLRGNLVHRLLQSLPGLAAAQRGAAAGRYLAQPGHGLNPENQAEIAREVLAILEDSRFSGIFAPGSQAEVSVSGRVGEQLIAGQIDRLAVTDSGVMIVDYKTNRPPPETAADTQVLYLRQMAAYQALLAQIYPEKTITCALLWTHGARLMTLPDELLAAYAP